MEAKGFEELEGGSLRRAQASRRKNHLILLTISLLLVVLTAAQVLVHRLRFGSPFPSNILIFALVNVNALLLLVLILLVFRSLFKVYLERRDNILGSKFRVKLVVAFVGLALFPALLLFFVASNLITTSIEGWFNVHIEESLQRSLEIAQTYYRTSQESTLAFTRKISGRIAEGPPLERWAPEALRMFLKEKLQEYHLSSIQVFAKGPRELAQVRGKLYPSKARLSYAKIVHPGLGGEALTIVQSLPQGDLIWGVAPVPSRRGEVVGTVVVSTLVPEGLLHKAQDITAGVKEYKQLKMWKSPIKGIYLMLFLMATLIIIFAAIWVGIHLARGITVPIQQLAEGTRAVAAGNLNYKVEAKADDEIGILVDSFNRMTDDLRKSKVELESASLDLKRSYEELERRRAYMETVLESISTGVLSLDQDGVVNTVNRAALRILDLSSDKATGRPFLDLFQDEAYAPIQVLLKRAVLEGEGSMDQQVLFPRNGRLATLVVSINRLWGGEGNGSGIVMVLEEITELLKAQQAMAWKEVASRIAHEIKNPLTPIKLSTQRLRKKFVEGAPDYKQVFEECTRTIIQEVEGLKGLVDEFSRYARMSSSNPQPGDLLPVIEKVVTLYRGLKQRVKVRVDLDPDLPPVNIDPEQMKRALVNLVDNALTAVKGKGEVIIRAKATPASSRILLEVIDTGCGISPQDKDRLFLPYFSTKRSGTGLGLAIVYRIVADHGGTVRAEDNLPKGTRMIIELPALPSSAGPSTVDRRPSTGPSEA